MAAVVPIRSTEKIRVLKILLRGDIPNSLQGKRNALLFVFGINTALRISDLLRLRVRDVVDSEGHLRENVTVLEKKTGKNRRFPLNESIRAALQDYPVLKNGPDSSLFPSSRGNGGPITRVQAYRILHEAAKRVGIPDAGTHSLRKTFGYHAYRQSGGNLGLVQKILNHGTSGDTLRYIGIDQEEMDSACLKLNL